jgi:hypothetical protein
MMLMLLSVLCVLGSSPRSAMAGPQSDPQAGPQSDIDAALARLGEHPPPPAFGEAETAESRRLRSMVAKRRKQLLDPKAHPTDEELAQASIELQPAFDRLRELNEQSRTWSAYQANPDGEWWRDAEPNGFELAPAGPVRDTPLDLVAFHATAKRLQVFEYFLANSNLPHRARYNYPEPTVAEALAIARAFEPFERGRIEIGGQGGSSGATGSYQLRAGYLRGRALTLAAFLLLDEERADEAHAIWLQAIGVLHRVEIVFKLAAGTRTELDSLAHLPAAGPELLAALRERDPHEFIPLAWDNATHRIGLAPGGWESSSTATDTARLLEDVCPWSPPVVELLEDLGPLRGFDLRVLRGPEIGTQSRGGMSLRDPQKIWIGSLGPAAIPPNVRRDLDEMRNGIVPDSERYLEWRAIRGAEELTVWVVSPRVRDIQASELLSWASKALTVYGGGAIAITADIAGDVIGKVVENLSPGNTPAQIGIGVGAESVPYEIAFPEGGGVKLEREGFNPVAMIKGALLSVLSAIEEAEIEALFEGLDPTSDHFDQRTNRSLSYAGGWVPPIILRAMVVGWERTDPDEYPRLRMYTRYWVLDPAGLTGEGRAFDLREQMVDQLPGAAVLRAGNAEGSASIWKPLPWAKTPEGWGSRARTVSLQPMTQTIRVSVSESLEEEWRADCPEGQDLCVVMRYGPAVDRGVDIVPLGDPFRFSDPGYSQREGLLPGFLSRPLRASYEAHIVRAKRRGTEFDVDATSAVELAGFPLRFTSREGAPVTGKLESDEQGLHAELRFTYEGRPRREFDLEPETTGAPLMPSALLVKGPYRQEGEIYDLAWCYDRLRFDAAFAPVEVDTWYQLDVHVRGADGSTDLHYQLHSFNREESGAAVFHGNIPVPIGRSEMRFSIRGSPSTEEVVEIVQRARDYKDEDLDMEDELGYIKMYLEGRERAEDQQGWLDYHCDYLSAKLSLAQDYAKIERWGTARSILHEVANEWPDVGRVQEESLREDYDHVIRKYEECLAEVALQQGDAAAMGPAGANHLTRQWGWAEESVAKYGDARRTYGELEDKYEIFIGDYLSLGGGEVFEHLLERWQELRRRSGRARPEDAYRFPRGAQGQ